MAVLILGPWPPPESQWFPSWDGGKTFGASVSARNKREGVSLIISRIYGEILEQHPDGDEADPFEIDTLLSDSLVNLSVHHSSEVYAPQPTWQPRAEPQGAA